ncbi:MAG: SpoIIE family protein phosphatase [Spirochaetaceae bacterium]|nr:SpoIIE family protein phosphatase [Spirochaetaceae bacterium]
MKKKQFSFASLSVRLPLYLALICIILSAVNGIIGYRVFKSLFERQYRDITEQIAETALSYIDVERISSYASGAPADEEWYETDEKLDVLTRTTQLAYIYVTVPDEKFENRVYIYDTVHPDVINGKKIELGKVSSLKKYDEQYIQNLKNVMLKGEPYIRFVYNSTGGHVTTSIPVKDSAGKNIAIMSVVKPMSEIQDFKKSYRNVVAVSSAIITFFFVVFFIVLLLARFVKPVSVITNETSHFAEHKGQLSERLQKIKGKDELGVLARAIEKMSVDMNKYIEDLTHTTAEKERLSAELDVATQIQANMLPRIFPPYKDHPELELFATMEPAKEVGGDFYDFFMVDDDHFAVAVGDVSGKGVPAALFMVIAKTLIKNSILQGLGPAAVFERVNNELCEGNDAGLFVTCWMGILTLSTGELKFVNAGHTFPVLCHDNKAEFLESKPNLMLAGMEGMSYTEHSATLTKGDRLFVYTDGVTEATDAKNELYGEERLINFIRGMSCSDIHERLTKIRADIDTFVDGAPQFDDITMLELSLKN